MMNFFHFLVFMGFFFSTDTPITCYIAFTWRFGGALLLLYANDSMGATTGDYA